MEEVPSWVLSWFVILYGGTLHYVQECVFLCARALVLLVYVCKREKDRGREKGRERGGLEKTEYDVLKLEGVGGI